MSTIGYYPLFCTVPQLPVELVNKLITSTRDVDFNVQNCFVLVLSPDQQDFHRGLEPITTPLTSNLMNTTIHQLAEISTRSFEGMSSSDLENHISVDPFVVIDERTLEDGTVRVVQSDVGFVYGRHGEIVTEEDIHRIETVRCEIEQLGWLLALLDEEGMILFKRDQEVPLGDDDVAEL